MTDVTPAAEWKSLYSGPRGTAVKVLNRVERTDSYLDKVLDAELRSGELNDLDKGLLTEVVHGVLRWQNRLDWVLNGFSHGNFSKSEINVKNILRVSLYQILFLERVPHSAAVNEGVEFIKRIRGDKPAGLVNAVLRNIIRNIEGIRYPDPAEDLVQYLAVFYSHPHWMVKRWLDRYGREATERLLMSNNERPSMALRVNRLKISPADFRARLDAQQITYTVSEHPPALRPCEDPLGHRADGPVPQRHVHDPGRERGTAVSAARSETRTAHHRSVRRAGRKVHEHRRDHGEQRARSWRWTSTKRS